MRKGALSLVSSDKSSKDLVRQYFNILISEFEAQGLRLPQSYSKAGISVQRFTMKSSLSIDEKNTVVKACYRQVFERDIVKAYSLSISDLESKVKNGRISVKEFIRALGKSYLYKKNFYEPFVNSRVLELAFRHFMGRGPSSLEEFQRYFSILSIRGLDGLIDSLINSLEYADYFGEETVPYFRSLGEEAQECSNWGPQLDLLNYSAPFRKIPQFITLFSDYKKTLPDQHPYGLSNDPLLIQFGAIFPNNRIALRKRSAPFGKDTRRILIRRGPGIYNQISSPSLRSKFTNIPGLRIFQLNSSSNSSSIALDSVIRAIYIRVFGRLIYQEELVLIKKTESKLRDGQISVRDFVRYLVKTNVFKSLYWQPFYVCKAIEYIHNRLLGRPTYGRQEINQYFDIAYKQGYNAFVDSVIDSIEYIETFGDNTVPYERYITPLGLFSRSNKKNMPPSIDKINQKSSKFIDLGQPSENRGYYSIQNKIMQGVTSLRDQTIIFKYQSDLSNSGLQQILKATYRQIFERDISVFSFNFEFTAINQKFISKEISVKELVLTIGLSSLYAKEFYQPYPNTKVIELGTKHFLGRAPNNQAEIRLYNQILASRGLNAFIKVLIESKEYNVLFGNSIVPYRRFPTLPAANFTLINLTLINMCKLVYIYKKEQGVYL